MKKDIFQLNDLETVCFEKQFNSITNRPGRKSNPLPSHPEEEEEEDPKPGKEDPKRKKKKRAYEVTC